MAGNSSLERVPLKRGSSGNGIGSFTEPVSNPRRPATTTTQDAQLYNVAQGLVPLMNNPAAASHPGGPVWCWPFGAMGDLSSIPPPLPPGMLPEVKLSDFRRYLHIVGDKYERFERGRIIVGPDANRRISVTDLTPGQSKHVQGEGLVAAMRQVPLRYFQEEFTLTRPETWQEECPEDSEDKRAAVLEELSQHLDVVETYLLREIAARSDNFFIASGVVQDLRMAIHRTYDQVKTLRQGVRELDEDVVEAAVTVQRLQRRRGNLMTVLDKLKVVEGISQSQMALQLLLPQADFAGALDVLDDMRATMEAEDLSGLHCFRHLPQQLMEVAEAVDELMASEFLRVTQLRSLDGAVDHVLQGLHQGPASNRSSADGTPYTSSSRLPSLANASIAVSTSGPDLSCYPELALIQNDAEEMRDMLAPLVLGLKRTGRLSASLRTYREAVAIEVKQGIREVVERGLPRLLSADWNSRETASLAEKLQGLQPSVFQQLLAGVFRITQACMRHCGEVRSLLAELLAASKTPRTQTEQLLQEFGEVAQSLSDAAHGRWTKLLGSRAAAHARLRMGELKELLGLCEAFAAMTEACGAKPVLSLRNAVQVQCRAFLDSMHTRSITQLTGLLDQESWTIAEVPSDFQSIADALMQRGADALPDAVGLLGADPLSNGHSHMGNGHAGPADPSEATTNAPSTSGCDGATSAGSPAGSAAQTATQQDSATVLVLGLQRFHVVNTALMLLKLLEEYLTFQDLVPAFGGEVARRVVELLKVFNSRTCQLVLGAGAMQVAGLKSITAKHLALSCQCLGALITLHPRLCAAFTAGVAQPRRSLLLPEFDRVLQDLTIHRGEIHSKLVAIMRERLSANVKQLPAIADRWGGAPGPREPSQFAQTNAKQLRILSQVLTPLLLPEELNFIFGRVGALFSKSLADAFSHIEPRGAGWQAQCQADLQLLISCLQNLPMAEAEKETHVERLAILVRTRFSAAEPSAAAAPGHQRAGSLASAGSAASQDSPRMVMLQGPSSHQGSPLGQSHSPQLARSLSHASATDPTHGSRYAESGHAFPRAAAGSHATSSPAAAALRPQPGARPSSGLLAAGLRNGLAAKAAGPAEVAAPAASPIWTAPAGIRLHYEPAGQDSPEQPQAESQAGSAGPVASGSMPKPDSASALAAAAVSPLAINAASASGVVEAADGPPPQSTSSAATSQPQPASSLHPEAFAPFEYHLARPTSAAADADTIQPASPLHPEAAAALYGSGSDGALKPSTSATRQLPASPLHPEAAATPLDMDQRGQLQLEQQQAATSAANSLSSLLHPAAPHSLPPLSQLSAAPESLSAPSHPPATPANVPQDLHPQPQPATAPAATAASSPPASPLRPLQHSRGANLPPATTPAASPSAKPAPDPYAHLMPSQIHRKKAAEAKAAAEAAAQAAAEAAEAPVAQQGPVQQGSAEAPAQDAQAAAQAAVVADSLRERTGRQLAHRPGSDVAASALHAADESSPVDRGEQGALPASPPEDAQPANNASPVDAEPVSGDAAIYSAEGGAQGAAAASSKHPLQSMLSQASAPSQAGVHTESAQAAHAQPAAGAGRPETDAVEAAEADVASQPHEPLLHLDSAATGGGNATEVSAASWPHAAMSPEVSAESFPHTPDAAGSAGPHEVVSIVSPHPDDSLPLRDVGLRKAPQQAVDDVADMTSTAVASEVLEEEPRSHELGPFRLATVSEDGPITVVQLQRDNAEAADVDHVASDQQQQQQQRQQAGGQSTAKGKPSLAAMRAAGVESFRSLADHMLSQAHADPEPAEQPDAAAAAESPVAAVPDARPPNEGGLADPLQTRGLLRPAKQL